MPEIDLDIHYHVRSVADDSVRFREAAQWIAHRQRLRRLVASVAIVGDADSRQWNRQHLGHDYATDVISFEIDGGSDWIDGEVIANAELAQRLAEKAGWCAEDELLLYVIHGLLHVVGLDDQTPQQAADMRQAEQECLTHLGVPGAEKHVQRWSVVSY